MFPAFFVAVDKDMVCGFEELGGVAGVIAPVVTAAPVMSCGGDLQVCLLNGVVEEIKNFRHRLLVSVIAEGEGAEPYLFHVDIFIFRLSLGE